MYRFAGENNKIYDFFKVMLVMETCIQYGLVSISYLSLFNSISTCATV